ncbi:MAG: M48 family metalloprotease [Vicinamibacteria bacterium]|nr:M48 family metalloprotease [Vicinamibacteria bacterium]
MQTRILLSIVLVAALACACVTNPVTGKRQLVLISEQQEIAMGRQGAEEASAALGVYDHGGLGAYVNSVGQRLAAITERPSLPWSFQVVDDAAVNAFAFPGGAIFVTRGLVTHVNSEAELAAVIGHEIGHVTARHSVSQMSKQTLATAGLQLGMILRPKLRDLGQIGQVGLALLMLKYSRDDENQADELGLRYMQHVGYPERAMADVMRMLERVSGTSSGGRLPDWLSTHPSPESRLRRIRGEIGDRTVAGRLGIRHDVYLRKIDGMVYGADVRQGFFKGRTFYHPDMAFRIDFPAGWATSNTRPAVGAQSPNQDAVVMVAVAGGRSPADAAQTFFTQSGVQRGRSWRDDINGAPAVSREFAAAAGEVQISGLVAFVKHGNSVLRLLAYTATPRWSQYGSALEGSIGSFARLTDRRYLSVQPMRLKVTNVAGATSIDQFARRQPSPLDARELALINGVEETGALPGGQLAKTVVGDEVVAEIVRALQVK